MLSRVAERLYWMGRYLERVESTARLVNAYTNQILDLPKGVDPGWRRLVDLNGASAVFEGHYQNYDERNTVKFLLADSFNPDSIASALAMARENVRTTRDVLPTEVWDQANEMYLYCKENAERGVLRKHRFMFLKQIVIRCQQITGLLTGTMSHDFPCDFIRLGRNLERGDMTTRIVDSAVSLLMPRLDAPTPYDNLMWVNVLKSLSAFQMYRQHVRHRVNGEAVVKYLLQDSGFPRSLGYALARAEALLGHLPRNEAPLQRVALIQRRVKEAALDTMALDEMHAFIDQIQAELNNMHEQISATWFSLEALPAVQTQVQAAAP
jgi:uncharacterized alpha-E superfamily protein